MEMTSAVLSPAQVERPEPAAGGVVTCTGLRRRYEAVVALDGIELDVRRGELLAVLGPSGCGKTTLLRLIAGFERPDEGTVILEGSVVAGPPAAASRPRVGAGVFVPPERRRVGIVVQDHALFPHLSVAGNVAYGLTAGGRSRRLRMRRRRDPARAARVQEVLGLVGLQDLGHRYPADLSGGQQQRVALARALAPRPRVVLLDEPFANLDAALRSRLRMEVRHILKAAGVTVVLVTHDQEEALSLADRVAVMDRGRVVQVGEPHDLYRWPADPFVARFVGESALVPGRSDGTAVDTPLGRLRVSGSVPPTGPVLAVIRPDAVRLTADPAAETALASRTATVVGAAYFGHDQLVELTLDGQLLRARVGSDRRFRPDERVAVEVLGDVVAFPA